MLFDLVIYFLLPDIALGVALFGVFEYLDRLSNANQSMFEQRDFSILDRQVI